MRSAVAEQHGLDEGLASVAIDAAPDPRITDEQQAAIDFAEAIVAHPADLSDDLVQRVHAAFTTEQLVELVLDVLKWSYQKVPVALGLDVEVRPGELTALVFDDDGHWVRPG